MSATVVTKPPRGLNFPHGNFRCGDRCLVDNCRHSSELILIKLAANSSDFFDFGTSFSYLFQHIRYLFSSSFLDSDLDSLILLLYHLRLILLSSDQLNQFAIFKKIHPVCYFMVHFHLLLNF